MCQTEFRTSNAIPFEFHDFMAVECDKVHLPESQPLFKNDTPHLDVYTAFGNIMVLTTDTAIFESPTHTMDFFPSENQSCKQEGPTLSEGGEGTS